MFASILSFTASAGYPLLFGLIMAESSGVPLPGETALIAAGAFAAAGQLSLPLVIAVAATAAVLGDNGGFALARRYGPGLLRHPVPSPASVARPLSSESHSSNATARRRSSWAAGLSACAPGPPGWQAPRA